MTDRSYQVQVPLARGRWRAAQRRDPVNTKPPTITADLPTGRTIAFAADGDNGVYRYTVTSNEAARPDGVLRLGRRHRGRGVGGRRTVCTLAIGEATN